MAWKPSSLRFRLEASADAPCFPPDQMALITASIPIDDQLELVGYVERALNVECGPSRGDVADNTADGTAIAKTDGCGLQHAGSKFVALLVHRIKTRCHALISWNFSPKICSTASFPPLLRCKKRASAASTFSFAQPRNRRSLRLLKMKYVIQEIRTCPCSANHRSAWPSPASSQ